MKKFKITATAKYTILRYLDNNYLDFIDRINAETPEKCSNILYSKTVNTDNFVTEYVKFDLGNNSYFINKGDYLNIVETKNDLYGTRIHIEEHPFLAKKFELDPTVTKHVHTQKQDQKYTIFYDTNFLENIGSLITSISGYKDYTELKYFDHNKEHYKSEFTIHLDKNSIFLTIVKDTNVLMIMETKDQVLIEVPSKSVLNYAHINQGK